MSRSWRSVLGIVLLAACVAAPGCKRKKSGKDGLPPVAEKKAASTKKDGDKKKDSVPTTYDFERAMVREITPENAGEKLVEIEAALVAEQAQLADLRAKRNAAKKDGEGKDAAKAAAPEKAPAASASAAPPGKPTAPPAKPAAPPAKPAAPPAKPAPAPAAPTAPQ